MEEKYWHMILEIPRKIETESVQLLKMIANMVIDDFPSHII
ncbi:hypothetical protein Godav_011587 [Gossypium davidsonii]|uniref:Uncharacterized protein n=2 Tax=Gossypium davidsonii TaxID=34287 RepID=A0A7J8RBS7_GOSDV|nr:hypothetical protein [Gossypium davidsonii]